MYLSHPQHRYGYKSCSGYYTRVLNILYGYRAAVSNSPGRKAEYMQSNAVVGIQQTESTPFSDGTCTCTYVSYSLEAYLPHLRSALRAREVKGVDFQARTHACTRIYVYTYTNVLLHTNVQRPHRPLCVIQEQVGIHYV